MHDTEKPTSSSHPPLHRSDTAPLKEKMTCVFGRCQKFQFTLIRGSKWNKEMDLDKKLGLKISNGLNKKQPMFDIHNLMQLARLIITH